MRFVVVFIFLSFILVSCEKEEHSTGRIYTYSGYLYEDCQEDEVFAGLELNFYDFKEGGFSVPNKKEHRGAVYTDSNGFYSITAEFRWDAIIVEDHKDWEVFKFINNHSGDNYSIWYNHPVSYHPVKILTNKSYSNQDTIYLGAKGGKYIDTLFSGPFANNQVFENIVFHTPFLSNGYVSATSDSEIKTNIVWGLGRNSYDSTANNVIGREQFYVKKVNQRMCKAGDTIVVDLRVLD